MGILPFAPGQLWCGEKHRVTASPRHHRSFPPAGCCWCGVLLTLFLCF